ncbi:MAG: transporter substrate-binding domain-containing protein [Phycisphaerae bacterium]
MKWITTSSTAPLAVAMALLIAVAALLGGCESKDESKLTVALTGKYPPFSTYDKEGNLVGVDVDVARAIASHMGREAKFVPTAWASILPGLKSGRYDVIIGSMAVTPERAKQVNFSDPYYLSGAQLFVHEKHADKVNSIEDAEGMVLGVTTGETYEHYLRRDHPDVEVRALGGAAEIFTQVEQGSLNGFVIDRIVGGQQIRKLDKPFVMVGPILYPEKMAIPVRKDRPELLKKVNAALKDMKKSGQLQEILDKWLGEGVAKAG